METQVAERIRKETSKSGLSVSRVYTSDYQKTGTVTAELRQTLTVKSFYPGKSVSNDMQDNIFGTQEFGFTEQEYTNVENRVAWIAVPIGLTPEKVAEKLATFPNANLYKVLSNFPILNSDQIYAIGAGITTKDVFAHSQIVRYPEGSTDGAGVSNAGQIVLDLNGKPQYRAVFFSNSGKEDEDRRTANPEEYYASEEIVNELQIDGHEQAESGQRL